MLLRILPILLLFIFPVTDTNAQLIETLTDTVGNPVKGTACFSLPVNGVDTSLKNAISPLPFCYGLSNRTFPSLVTISPNDVIQMNNYYHFQVNDRSGLTAFNANYPIHSGAPQSTRAFWESNNTWTGLNILNNSSNAFAGIFNEFLPSENVDNVITVDGDRYTTLAQAYAACPSSSSSGAGCTIDMRGNSSSAALALGTFDPGNIEVTILLGPWFYTAAQITLRSGLHIIGTGRSNVTQSTTNIQGTNTSIGSAVFIGPGPTQSPALGVLLQGFSLFAPGRSVNCAIPLARNPNVTDGILVDASTSTNSLSGLWYSEFHDLQICGFGGNGIHFKGGTGGGTNGINQFVTIADVDVFRASGANTALRIEGANYQFFFENCQFDSGTGNVNIDTSTTYPNVFIGGGPGSNTGGYPYIINFNGATIQGAQTLVQIDGASNVTFHKAHHEAGYGAYQITYGANGANVHTDNIVITDTSFNGNVGINRGNGFLLKSTTSHANGLVFRNNLYLAPGGANPDNFILDTSGVDLIYADANEINDANGIFFYNYGYTVAGLPSASLNAGVSLYVNNSTTIVTEGQTCVGGGTAKALAFSNGSVWKCF